MEFRPVLTFSKSAVASLLLASLVLPTAATAVSLVDILAIEDVGTDFTGVTPGQPVPSGHLNNAEFNSPPGVGVFFNSVPWYVSGSIRAWGFFDPGVATIDFPTAVETVTVAARGSTDVDVLGFAAAPPALPSEPLAEATGFVEAVGAGDVVLASVPIENTNLVTQSTGSLISFDAATLGEPIVGLNLVNASPIQAERSLVVIGAIGVPEPGFTSLTIWGLLSIAALRRPLRPSPPNSVPRRDTLRPS